MEEDDILKMNRCLEWGEDVSNQMKMKKVMIGKMMNGKTNVDILKMNMNV